MEFREGGWKSTAGEGCWESEWIRGRERLKEGAERQIEAWGSGREEEYKEFPPSWNTLSALGQKNAKMFHFTLLFPRRPPSLSLIVCFKMPIVPEWANCRLFCILPCCCANVCGRAWEMESFCTFFLQLWFVMSRFTEAHQKILFFSDTFFKTSLLSNLPPPQPSTFIHPRFLNSLYISQNAATKQGFPSPFLSLSFGCPFKTCTNSHQSTAAMAPQGNNEEVMQRKSVCSKGMSGLLIGGIISYTPTVTVPLQNPHIYTQTLWAIIFSVYTFSASPLLFDAKSNWHQMWQRVNRWLLRRSASIAVRPVIHS